MRDFDLEKWHMAVIGLLFWQYVSCEISCNPPPPTGHGTVLELHDTHLTTFPHGFEITYVCDEGYRISTGRRRSRCEERGWSGKTPRCEAVECPYIGVPENGEILGTNYRVGSKVSFVCYPGYELLGSRELECLARGQWSDLPARCNAPSNHCPDPGIPIGGSKNSTEYGRGDRVGFRCQTGHILVGSEVRECLRNRTWSGLETRCIWPEEFGSELQVADMLRVEELRQKRKSRNANSSNNRGWLDTSFPEKTVVYFVFDVSRSIRLLNFEKSIAFAKAIVKQVGISVDGPLAGALTFSSVVDTQFSPVTYNSTEDVLTALDRIQFSGGGGTDVNSVLREIREDCMPRVQYSLGGRRTKSVVFLLTDGKVNRGGDPGRESNVLKAQGAKIFCVGVTADVKMRTLRRVASTSIFGEGTRPNVFVLREYDSLRWVVQEITTGTVAPNAFLDPTLRLRAHWDWNNRVTHVNCSSEQTPHKMEFSRVLDTGTGRALPAGARTYSRVKAASLDLSGVPHGGSVGVYQCGYGRDARRTAISFVIDPTGDFVRSQVASIGDRVDFLKTYDDDPSFRWLHDGRRVQDGDGRGRLVIAGVRREDSGYYEIYKEGDRRGSQRFFKLVVRGCPANMFGDLCDGKCPPCYNGGICHDLRGVCICSPGFQGSNCEVACGKNQVGPNCSERCEGGDCQWQYFCHPDPFGCSCAAGHRGFLCQFKCRGRKFGAGCKQMCRCAEGHCDARTGACPEGCSGGWTGQSCQIPAGN